MRTARNALLIASLLAIASQAAAGQLAAVVKETFDKATPNAVSTVAGGDHTSHFFLGDQSTLAPASRQLNVALVTQLTSFPLASSSGGFTFNLNDRGEVVPTSNTFGPSFAERAVTIGQNKFNFGYTFQRTTYDSYEGVGLDSGDLRFFVQHNNCCPAGNNSLLSTTDLTPDFERDLLLNRLRVDITTRTTAFFANYGVTNRFDIGVAVPIVNVNIDATVDAEILRTATAASPLIHSFDGQGTSTRSVSGSGSASGLGDVLLRAKYNLFRSETTAFAAALDLRLPTGDEDDPLGTGATQAQAMFVASGEYGRLSPHVNLGYTFSNGEASGAAADVRDPVVQFGAAANGVDSSPLDETELAVPDEFNYTLGLNVAAGARVTLGFDVKGRMFRDLYRFAPQDVIYPNRAAGAVPTASFTAQNEFDALPRSSLNQLLGVAGGKINPRWDVPLERDGALPAERRWAEGQPHARDRFRLRVLMSPRAGPDAAIAPAGPAVLTVADCRGMAGAAPRSRQDRPRCPNLPQVPAQLARAPRRKTRAVRHVHEVGGCTERGQLAVRVDGDRHVRRRERHRPQQQA